jgi:hypothetical protein
MRLSQEEFVGVRAISTLFAAAQVPTRWHFFVVGCGEKLSRTIAIRTLPRPRRRATCTRPHGG